MPIIRSVDGRRQKIQVGHWDLIALYAWKANSYQEYLANSGIWPEGWGVWAFEVVNGCCLSRIWGWEQPRQNLTASLDELMRRPKFVQTVLRYISLGPQTSIGLFKVKSTLDYFKERLVERNVPESHPIFAAITTYHASQKNLERIKIVALVVLLICVAAFLVFFFRTVSF